MKDVAAYLHGIFVNWFFGINLLKTKTANNNDGGAKVTIFHFIIFLICVMLCVCVLYVSRITYVKLGKTEIWHQLFA